MKRVLLQLVCGVFEPDLNDSGGFVWRDITDSLAPGLHDRHNCHLLLLLLLLLSGTRLLKNNLDLIEY